MAALGREETRNRLIAVKITAGEPKVEVDLQVGKQGGAGKPGRSER